LNHVGDQLFIIKFLANCSKGVPKVLDFAEVVGNGEILLLEGGELDMDLHHKCP
jgi:hypothetical protein